MALHQLGKVEQTWGCYCTAYTGMLGTMLDWVMLPPDQVT